MRKVASFALGFIILALSVLLVVSLFSEIEPHWQFAEFWSIGCHIESGQAQCILSYTNIEEPATDRFSFMWFPFARWEQPDVVIYSFEKRGCRHSGFGGPLWLALVIFLSVATIVAVARRRRRELSECGICLHCGYNLTGLPEPRCPECGTNIALHSASSAHMLPRKRPHDMEISQ
jgi:hypothetical protein